MVRRSLLLVTKLTCSTLLLPGTSKAIPSSAYLLHGVKRNQSSIQICKVLKRLHPSLVIGTRGKSSLEKFRITLAITRRMKNGVGVIENIFRAESLFQIAPPIWHKFQINRISKMFHKFGRKIWAATIFMRHKFSLFFRSRHSDKDKAERQCPMSKMDTHDL